MDHYWGQHHHDKLEVRITPCRSKVLKILTAGLYDLHGAYWYIVWGISNFDKNLMWSYSIMTWTHYLWDLPIELDLHHLIVLSVITMNSEVVLLKISNVSWCHRIDWCFHITVSCGLGSQKGSLSPTKTAM